MRNAPRLAAITVAGITATLLLGCTQAPVTPTASPTIAASPSPTVDPLTMGPVRPVGEPTVIASGLAAPWSMVRLASGSTLISERDTGTVKELTADGTVREVATIAGVVHVKEGGLLGLEFVEDDGDWLYAYVTTGSDNRIVRFPLLGEPGRYALGAAEEILAGLAKADTHNGGRIKLGPDNKLYATVGDATDTTSSQDLSVLNGKILRLNLDGSVPADNPFSGSLIYSYGHRNPQGLAWDAEGQLWAAEFGQDTWDEFNVIRAGGNYGWPVVEGASDDSSFINPVFQWPTDDASPSGLAFTRDTFFLAGLKGERLWALYPGDTAGSVPYFVDTFGRLRDVVAGPEGTLWVLTNNTDGRGTPEAGDDRILQVELTPGT